MLSQFTTKHSNCWLWRGRRSSFPPCPARARQLGSPFAISWSGTAATTCCGCQHCATTGHLPLLWHKSGLLRVIGNMEILKRKNRKPHFSHCWAPGNVQRLGLGSYYAQSCNHYTDYTGHTIHHHTTCVTWHSLVLIKICIVHCILFVCQTTPP